MKNYKILLEGNATGRRGYKTTKAKSSQEAGEWAEKKFKDLIIITIEEIKNG